MYNIMFINEFDLLMIIFLFMGVIYGAIRGATRQTKGLISAWFGLLVCLWLYIPFSRRVLKGIFLKLSPDSYASNVVFDTLAFVILIITFTGLAQLLFIYSSKAPEEKRDTSGKTFMEKANKQFATTSANVFNLFGGLVTGFITTSIWLSLFLAPTQYVLSSVGTGGLQTGLGSAMNSSLLLPFFHMVLYWVYLSIRLFTPGSGLPSIFSGVLG
jgi:hypothetical protein